jgi:hypothetical protein
MTFNWNVQYGIGKVSSKPTIFPLQFFESKFTCERYELKISTIHNFTKL